MSFPTIVYKTPGSHQRAGGTYSYLGIEAPEALDAALGEGWFKSLPEAIAGQHELPADNSAPTREELETKAAELAIKFDGRTTDKLLAEKIAFTIEQGD